MNKRVLGCVAVVCATLAPRLAAAQTVAAPVGQGPTWLDDRRIQEGAGIRTGNLELHPGFGGEVGYDSNFLLRTHKDPPAGKVFSNANPEGAFRLRITPSLTLSTLGSARSAGEPDLRRVPIAFRASLTASYLEFFGADIIRRQRNVAADARAVLSLFHKRPLGFDVFASYTRSISPNALGNPDLAFTRNVVNAGGDFVITPGGGTLEYRLGYSFTGTFFETTGTTQYNSLMHSANVRGRWNFTPRTALVSDASVSFMNYTSLTPDSPLVNLMPIRARLGVDGLLTPKIGLVVLAGYGATFLDNTPSYLVRQYNSIIGEARLTYFLTANPDSSDAQSQLSTVLSRISLAYIRDYQFSVVSNFYGIDRGELAFDALFAGRAAVRLSGGVSAIQYPDIPSRFAPGTVAWPSSTDVRPDVTLFGEYRFSDTFALNSTFRYTQNFSKIQLPLGVPDPANPTADQPTFDFNWRRFEAFLGVRWFL